jgi:hypothetical protein
MTAARAFRAFLCLALSLPFTVSVLAQQYSVAQCNQDFNDKNLTAVSRAFNLCTPSHEDVLHANAVGLQPAVNLEDVQRRLYRVFQKLTRANVNVTCLAAQEADKTRASLDWVKVSGIVVGGVGGGVGSGLRLVNDPHVAHAGTVVSMAGGILGASINLADVFVPSGSKCPHAKEALEEVKGYFEETEPQLLQRSKLTPSGLSLRLAELSDSLEQAQALLDQKRVELQQNNVP